MFFSGQDIYQLKIIYAQRFFVNEIGA